MNEVFTSHGFELSTPELAQFERFLSLFIEYNAHTNLSAIRDEEGIILKHFVDSLYGASLIETGWKKRKLLDIWSGWGFPGIPLRIVFPELDVTLLDSVGKKVKAMEHFARELGLTDVRAIQERAEVLGKKEEYREKFDFVVSRATAYITDILMWATPFLAPSGKILLYKMPSKEERKDMEKLMKKLSLRLVGELPYTLAEKERVIYVIERR